MMWSFPWDVKGIMVPETWCFACGHDHYVVISV